MSRGFIQIIFLIAVLVIGAIFVWPTVRKLAGDLRDLLPIISPIQSTKKSTVPPRKTPSEKKAAPEVIIKSEPDSIPPKMSNPKPVSVEPGSLKTTLSLETDEKAFCKYDLASGLSLDSMQKFFSKTDSTSHSVLITTLIPGKKHSFFVKCRDVAGNETKDDLVISFDVPPPKDTVAPERRYPYPSGDKFPAGTRQVTISVTTDEAAICRYSADPNNFVSSFSSNEQKTYHYTTITGLEDGKSYDYFANCCDLSQNCNSGGVLINFSVGR